MILKFNIWRIGIWLLFPLLGTYSYLHSEGYKLLGYVILYVPYMLYILSHLPWLTRQSRFIKIRGNNRRLGMIFGTFMIILLIASFRSIAYDFNSIPRFIAKLLFIILLLAYFRIYSRKENEVSGTWKNIWSDIGLSIGILLALNLIAFVLFGLESRGSNQYIEQTTSRISFLASKVHFPFISQTRELSQLAGLLLVIAICTAWNETEKIRSIAKKFFVLVLMPFPIIIIILADARMTLIVTIATSLIAFYFARRYRRAILSWGLSIFYLMFPAIYFMLVFYVNLNTEIDIFDSDLWTLTGRLYIWASVLPEILGLSGAQILFGSGAFSQGITGMSDNYAMVFANWADTEMISFHNSMIQSFFDIGLIGLSAYVLLVLSILKVHLDGLKNSSIDESSRLLSSTGIIILLYYLALGMTEALTPLYYDSFMIILIVLSASASQLGESINANRLSIPLKNPSPVLAGGI